MRTIRRTARFRRDYKRMAKGRYGAILDAELRSVVAILIEDNDLPETYRDHALTGDWNGYRDCHLRPDLLLIYAKLDDRELTLVRLGSHSDLGW
ncbi:type II toxin-antitoxin system YafQ family toxin [Aurantimonas sp. E1-2-R+4]|uniref:type II toxin-antitoxin system YafQ family toxin n=1 Tax=Aurantimonas sp. E1-2-R+4 TaxID=3113714 RepID=UPI002F92D168